MQKTQKKIWFLSNLELYLQTIKTQNLMNTKCSILAIKIVDQPQRFIILKKYLLYVSWKFG